VTSDPITAGLSQETDMLLDDNHITNACTHCHVFLDHIQSRRKLVWGLENNGQEQDHIVMYGRYREQEGDSCHGHIVVS